jgi:hypothetical protein
MGALTVRVNVHDYDSEGDMLRAAIEEARHHGLSGEHFRTWVRDAYRLDSGTHIAYARDVVVRADDPALRAALTTDPSEGESRG